MLTTTVKRADALEARAAQVDGHIFICTDDQFSGECTNYGFVDNVCSNFPGEFQDDISSFGPDQGWICTLFMYLFNMKLTNAYHSHNYCSNDNCNSNQGTYDVQYPGFTHLDYGNDAFSSLRCFRIN